MDASTEVGLGRLLKLFLPRRSAKDDFRPLDFGMLQVAMMLAAMDGTVIELEIGVFGKLARKCRGWTAEAAEEALEVGLHAAGYLMIQSHRLTERHLIKAFVDEAMKVLSGAFVAGSVIDKRRAFVMWIAMACCDRRFAVVERKAVLALRRRLGLEKVVTDRFLREVEDQFRRLGHEDTVVEAVRTLGSFLDLEDV